MLSQTAEYALRAILHLAEQAALSDRPVSVTDMAVALDVPRNYLSKTLHQLSRAGVVASTFGPGGGFRLARPADVMTLDEVVAPFDDQRGERHCLLGRARCKDSDPCQAHAHWKGISTQIQHFFRTTTVATLLLPGHADSPLLPTTSRGSHGTPRRTRARK
ncbi:MAG: RrF2 family transcriptional regulator [Gemmatimonadaceae bacterium]